MMVACGSCHTVVLAADSRVWTCGSGQYGQLGHGDTVSKLVLTLVGEEQIAMVAAGSSHSVALGTEGRVRTWGMGKDGQLGHNDQENRLVPTLLAGEALGAAVVVFVAAGRCHTVLVTNTGALWTWGCGRNGRLGLGDIANRLAPTLVGAGEAFGESHVLTAACGTQHTLAVTKDGTLWSWGSGAVGHVAKGKHTQNHWLVPTRIEAQHFGNSKIISAAAGNWGEWEQQGEHSAAVTEDGGLYTWGRRPGLGLANGKSRMMPTPVDMLQRGRVGRCHKLLPLHALAFAMGTHSRLGSAAPTAAAAGDDSQRRSQRQKDKAPAEGKKASGLASQSLIGARVCVQCRCGAQSQTLCELSLARSHVYTRKSTCKRSHICSILTHSCTHTHIICPSAMVVFTRARFRLGTPKSPSIPSY